MREKIMDEDPIRLSLHARYKPEVGLWVEIRKSFGRASEWWAQNGKEAQPNQGQARNNI